MNIGRKLQQRSYKIKKKRLEKKNWGNMEWNIEKKN